MSSFDKTVKLACKPKPAPPKAKYLDPIIAATYSEDGTVHDVCKALAPRLREPNAVVVFKALLVLHTMIRNGATDNVLTYLSSEDVLKLRSVSTGHWAGYEAPKNMQNYALYLDSRIRTYRDLKHDPIRVQSDANRDHRVESEIEASRGTNTKRSNTPQRSKTIMGRKLRSMTVEKGLLRETKAVQKTIDTLLECRFFLDNLEDELNVTALRFLVKDLIVLFQALNEGVINVLEHYFEMSHIDAETALGIYRKFCKETDMVVEYLGIARKLQNLLNVPIPNLKHAPVSLVKALEEYLSDPNFEQNRIEYKAAKTSADKNSKNGSKTPSRNEATSSKNNSTPATQASSSSEPVKSKDNNQALVDFFSSIEEEQSSMFNTSPSNQLQHLSAQPNPFVVQQQMMATGAFPQVQQPFGIGPQMTGFAPPQSTMPTIGPLPGQQSQQHNTHPSFASFLHPQTTGFPQPLQAQATGVNPFRQSMMFPQATGMAMPGAGMPTGPPFIQNSVLPIATPSFQPYPVHSASAGPEPSFFPRPPMPSEANSAPQPPARPASTPANSAANTMKPLVTHQTGSRNPFGAPVASPPPVPKAPTLQELASGTFNTGSNMFASQSQPLGAQQVSTPTGAAGLSFGQTQQSTVNGGSGISNIASSFTSAGRPSNDGDKPKSDVTGASSFTSKSTFSSNLFSQPTGSTMATGSTSILSSPSLQPQTTGFSGLKAFKPTSSFGASLFESLPPIPQSNASSTEPNLFSSTLTQSPVTAPSGQSSPPQSHALSLGFSPNAGSSTQTASAQGPSTQGSQPFSLSNNQPFSTGTPNFNSITSSSNALPPSFASQNTTPQSLSLGVGLRPQMTGGVANPFRASMFSPSTTNIGSSPFPAFSPTQFGSLNNQPASGAPAFGGLTHNTTPVDTSKQQSGVASLF